jgi:hypothetical protein
MFENNQPSTDLIRRYHSVVIAMVEAMKVRSPGQDITIPQGVLAAVDRFLQPAAQACESADPALTRGAYTHFLVVGDSIKRTNGTRLRARDLRGRVKTIAAVVRRLKLGQPTVADRRRYPLLLSVFQDIADRGNALGTSLGPSDDDE